MPLNLHYQATMDAMRAGKHVLCEKLMAWNVKQCKDMIKLAEDPAVDRVLSIGHQRHYSMLYAHANEIVKSDVLGDIRHIRAQWHRNNTVPGRDSWRKDPPAEDKNYLTQARLGGFAGEWKDVDQLVRWRLYHKTGAGLMAELGSHQLDACSIFLGKRQPLSVSGVGGIHFYHDDREVEDHVYCTFEFPGQVVQRSRSRRFTQSRQSEQPRHRGRHLFVDQHQRLRTVRRVRHGFEGHADRGAGRGRVPVRRGPRATSVSVAAGGALAASSTTPGDTSDRKAQDLGQASLGTAPPSKGYREEMEHFAYIIRNRPQGMGADRAALKPRCDGRAALNDAVMALVSNIAMRQRKRIEFKADWFNADSPALPETDLPG